MNRRSVLITGFAGSIAAVLAPLVPAWALRSTEAKPTISDELLNARGGLAPRYPAALDTVWARDCLRWRGRHLVGERSHWCWDHDGLPCDETTPEACSCTWEHPEPGYTVIRDRPLIN